MPARKEAVELMKKWEKGVPDVKILESIRWINGIARGWKTGTRHPIDAQPN
jgi:hypothetical protein